LPQATPDMGTEEMDFDSVCVDDCRTVVCGAQDRVVNVQGTHVNSNVNKLGDIASRLRNARGRAAKLV